MKLYWFQSDIPALQGLTRAQLEAAKRPVIRLVWRHWQVWLPQIIQVIGFVLYIVFAPRFPYRFPVTIILILITTRIAGLPFHHYLNYYLNRRSAETPAPPTTPHPIQRPGSNDTSSG